MTNIIEDVSNSMVVNIYRDICLKGDNSIELVKLLKHVYEQLDFTKLRDSGTFVVWVIGGPASGKTTLCSRLAEDFSFVHISISQLLHTLMADNDIEHQRGISTIKKGQIVPTEFILFAIKQEMARNMPKKPKGFLLDGFPLESSQAYRFEKEVAPVDCILYLVVDEGTLIERIYYRSKAAKGVVEPPKNVYTKLKTFREFEKTFSKQYLTKIRDINANADLNAVYRKCVIIINDMIIKHYTMKVLTHKNVLQL